MNDRNQFTEHEITKSRNREEEEEEAERGEEEEAWRSPVGEEEADAEAAKAEEEGPLLGDGASEHQLVAAADPTSPALVEAHLRSHPLCLSVSFPITLSDSLPTTRARALCISLSPQPAQGPTAPPSPEPHDRNPRTPPSAKKWSLLVLLQAVAQTFVKCKAPPFFPTSLSSPVQIPCWLLTPSSTTSSSCHWLVSLG